ncbi:uncharacterized protein LACBIDRAFT_322575 [Laccaria bicolor S238N-H82]|uniref:Predicted protein n=1 Tax=Laccaria bicolor (strain S238N-H82 / ATCC MYA-4686) TaxID=486041 RepID=B0CWS8_LACBS|nr:uncharacterized protein LACBIDRAFT_322575 [Laccaria bicolor S238N-H82]EDR13124.1 predicted protein [Laccaria bicolor S238N-H82]|eukprot:XP_001875622.1 predicted protein [Laccaria bicolor S238N-H82]
MVVNNVDAEGLQKLANGSNFKAKDVAACNEHEELTLLSGIVQPESSTHSGQKTVTKTKSAPLTDMEQEMPISSLPPKMLTEIFVLCCQPKYNTIGGVDSQEICHLRLAAVCKAWRDLAWTMSRLWSVITLVNPNPHALHLEGILASWIERAGNKPLSIHYEGQNNGLLARLIQETPKWINVSILLPSESLSVIKKCKYFPLLEHLFLCGQAGIGSNPDGLEDFDIFNCSSLPNISRLHVPRYLHCFEVNLMWSQLRTFSTMTVGHKHLRDILRLAEFLEVFNANSFMPDTDGIILQTVHHSYL